MTHVHAHKPYEIVRIT